MRTPDFITFTGADDWTDVEEMKRLAARYPIEWGILFSPARQGKDPRYPKDPYWRFTDKGLRLSAHLCGAWARGVMQDGTVPLDLASFKRVQVNHMEPSALRAEEFAARLGVPVILQTRRPGSFPMQDEDFKDVSWLFDASGGRGVRPFQWPRHPGRNRLVGYAGGITPENVMQVLEEIDHDGLLSANATPYWIDMESGVRTDERFDLAKVEAVCKAVYG